MACARTIPERFDGGRMNFQMPGMLDVWRFEYNGEASLEWAATREVAQVKWMTPEEIRRLYDGGGLVASLRYFFERDEL